MIAHQHKRSGMLASNETGLYKVTAAGGHNVEITNNIDPHKHMDVHSAS